MSTMTTQPTSPASALPARLLPARQLARQSGPGSSVPGSSATWYVAWRPARQTG